MAKATPGRPSFRQAVDVILPLLFASCLCSCGSAPKAKLSHPVAESSVHPCAKDAPNKVPPLPNDSAAKAESEQGPLPSEPSPKEPRTPGRFDSALPSLGAFYTSLAELEQGTAKSSVRIMWLGDSHVAADFLTDEVRRALWARFPSGGPGFVHLGLDGTRHGGIDSEHAGRFRHQPVAPATQTRTLDGVFGYGGVRTIPKPGALFRLKAKPSQVERVTLTYRLDPGDAFSVSINGKNVSLSSVHADDTLERSTWFVPEAASSFELVVQGRDGTPEFFGADLETRTPGVILDTLGLNGARLKTPLAWEPWQFTQEIGRRAPVLIVISYGTNEAFDKRATAVYRDDLRRLVALIRSAVPRASFWIHGPPDSGDPSGKPNPRVGEITEVLRAAAVELDCAFTSQAELMSYEGGFSGWRNHSPPWARPDNIHLTVDGYRELGRRLAEVLLGIEPESIPEATEVASL
jgi:lysophospholipase L1-like esterase